ncbi:Uncharacterized protein LHYA1_G006832 [Lachnellula hyalina]|uniref:SRP9 domain-containing protein n=1 Tax=Lachnellula hyalina TaxID=1316788 RepID=A0A8H8QZ95_9HELO|nr:Uncharacterized protein LHYA1_G006832 [Lachnellula hyalina]TVY24786.1 Uncharacterized protein LHYA1_G006832 [Lachnellula hyalina]
MPYLATAQEWLTQSTLLLQARPSTTRITTKYTHASTIAKKSKSKPRRNAPPTESTALLTLKTYDPASGATLKYETDKAAEVGRLMMILGRLGRGMAGLEVREEGAEGEVKEEVKEEGREDGKVLGGAGDGKAAQQGGKAAGGAAGGGGKGKKKKGKK